MSYQDFINSLDPKIAKSVKTAAQVEIIRRPLASRRLTYALGGGIGAGRITTIYGNFSAGKTLLTLQSIAQWQKQGLVCAFIDVEGTYDPNFAAKLGVNNEELIVYGNKNSGRISNDTAPLLKAGIDVIALDSISAVMPEVFVDSKTSELLEADKRKQMGAHAKAIKTIISGIHYNNEKTAVILLSQTTTQIESTYVKQVPHGGNSPMFDSSTVIRLTSSNTDSNQKKGLIPMGDLKVEVPIGRTVKAFVEKNKLHRQHTTAEYDLYYDGDFIGIDADGELVDMCVDFGIVSKGGAWFNYNDSKWQGRDSIISAVRNDNDLKNELDGKLNEILYGRR